MLLRNPRLVGVRILICRQWLLSALKSDMGDGTSGHICKLGLTLEGCLPPHGHRELLQLRIFRCVSTSNRLRVCMHNKGDFPLVLSTQLADDISVHNSTYMHAEFVQDCRYANAAKCSRPCRTLHQQQHAFRFPATSPSSIKQNPTSRLLFK